jgi:hypothetical protein
VSTAQMRATGGVVAEGEGRAPLLHPRPRTSCGRSPRGSGIDRQVVRQYAPIVAIVLLCLGGADWVISAALPSSHADLEWNSAQIGWAPAMESDHLARDMYIRVNDERTARGLAPLLWDEELADRARRWSETMIATRYEHSTAEFRAHPAYTGTGENIHMGTQTANGAHVGWMLSDGHRDNILYPGFTAVGIGVVCRNDGRMWATQIFGVPAGTYPDPPVPTTEEPIVRRDDGPACTSRRAWSP